MLFSPPPISRPTTRIQGMKVAIAQLEPILGDVPANLEKHLARIDEAVRQQAKFILFPELSLTGYHLQDMVADVAQEADRSDPLRQLRERSRDISIEAGFVEQSPGIRFFNSAAFFERGEIVHIHRKVYLPTYGMFDEGRDFGPGETFRAFPTDQGRMGILTCEDLWHTSSAFLLTQDGAEIILIPSNSPIKGVGAEEELASQTTWLELARTTARFQTVFLLYGNRVGCEEGIQFGGGSFALDPNGRILARSTSRKEGLLFAELDPELLREARTCYPLVRDEKLDLVYRELGRIRKRKFNL